jgi:beta-lactamase class C
MINPRITFFLLVALLMAACTQTDPKLPYGASLRPTPPPLDPELEAFLKDYHAFFRDSMILTGTPGAAVVIVKDSQVVFIKGYGVRSEDTKLPVDEHTVFRIGSLSKGFAGVLTSLLETENKLQWYDAVHDYIPNFTLSNPEQAGRVQVKHLLTQTTGLPYHSFSNLIEQGFSKEHILAQFPLARLAGKEGEHFSYQNAAFCLIEPILEQVSGKPYNELIAERIFQPLGMADASCSYEGIANLTNHAKPHRHVAYGWAADSINHRYYNFPAAGGVNASATDMGEWLVALLGHKPHALPTRALNRVFEPAIGTGLERPVLRGYVDRDSAYYGMGWRVLHHWGDTLVYHAGFVNNYHAEIAMDRRDGIGICVMFNAPSPLAGECISGFFRRWRKARGYQSTVSSPQS